MRTTQVRKSPALLAVHMICLSWFMTRVIIGEFSDFSAEGGRTARANPSQRSIANMASAESPTLNEVLSTGQNAQAKVQKMMPESASIGFLSRKRAVERLSVLAMKPDTWLELRAINLHQSRFARKDDSHFTHDAITRPFSHNARPLPGLIDRSPARSISIDGWMIMRGQKQGSNLTPQGSLGGSQVGMRARLPLSQSLDRPNVAATVSFASPIFVANGKQIALGLASRPVAKLPIEVIIEHRFPLGGGEKPKMVALIAGGLDDVRLAQGFSLATYGQLGLAGLKQREAFVDGSLTMRKALPGVGGLRVVLGAGIWGAAQPRLARIDVGPMIEVRPDIKGLQLAVGLQWRLRAAGNASPDSGPALTVSSSF